MTGHSADKKHTIGSLTKIFMAKTAIVAGLMVTPLVFAQIANLNERIDEYNDRLEGIGFHFAENIEDVCVDARKRQPVMKRDYNNWGRDNYKRLTEEQKVLRHLLETMDETDIGRQLNRSAAYYDTIWCANGYNKIDGSYYNNIFLGGKEVERNFAVVNLKNFGGADAVKNDDTLYNRALRTAYEENAHAWQANAWNTHEGLEQIRSKDYLTWHVAIEAAARVTTFAALYQHEQNGDHAIWNDNVTDSGNRSIMLAFHKAIKNGRGDEITIDSLWESFDAFYDYESLLSGYQIYYSEDAEKKTGTHRLFSGDYIRKLGHVPGVQGNYLDRRGFTPDDDRYSKPRSEEIKFGT